MNEPLQRHRIDPSRITVSGISAGAFMAHQLHLAHAELFRGVGLIAGGPFMASGGNLMGALHQGLLGGVGSPETSAHWVRLLADSGLLASTEHLKGARVWLFHGALDRRVHPAQTEALAAFYRKHVKRSNLALITEVEVGHAFPTAHWGTPDSARRSPYIANANFDAAGFMLRHLEGKVLEPRGEAVEEGLRAFTQTHYLPADTWSMNETGYVYLPKAARQGKSCGIHVILHGCGQSRSQVGELFVRHTGYLEWAENNGLILLFPQVRPTDDYSCYNPLASWDWWGYEDPAFSTRAGRQIRAIVAMVRALGAP